MGLLSREKHVTSASPSGNSLVRDACITVRLRAAKGDKRGHSTGQETKKNKVFYGAKKECARTHQKEAFAGGWERQAVKKNLKGEKDPMIKGHLGHC